MYDLVLRNCKLVDKSGNYYVGIEDGKIREISKQPLKSGKEINIDNQFVLPGLIDPHVHFRDPGLTYKESFKTGSLTAAHGGFTTVLDMPNTIPPTNTAKNFKDKKKIGEKKSIIDFGLHSGLNDLEELEKIAKLNPVSFKIFMDLFNDNEIEEMFKNVSRTNENLNKSLPLTLHCENKAIVEENTNRLKKLESARGNTALDYSYTRPSEAEMVSIAYAAFLAEKYNISLHICHLSTKKALEYIQSITEKNNKNINSNTQNPKENKNTNNNTKITIEATPHHIFLDNTAFNRFGTMMKTNPPLRKKGESLTVSDLANIDMIGTDHAPHSLEEKQKEVWDSSPGIPNLETVLPLLLTEVNNGTIDLKTIQRLMSEAPAKRFNMKNKGKIDIGYDADFVVLDLKKEGKFNIDTFYTKAEYSPFENISYKGINTMTISNGNIIMDEENILDMNLSNINRKKYIYD